MLTQKYRKPETENKTVEIQYLCENNREILSTKIWFPSSTDKANTVKNQISTTLYFLFFIKNDFYTC